MRPLLLLPLVLIACGSAAKTPIVTPASCPATSAQPGDVSVFASGLKGTEGLAFSDDGRLFVSAGSAILEVKADGSHEAFATVPKSVGAVWWKDALYVAGAKDAAEPAGGGCAATHEGAIWKVSKTGVASVFATGVVAPNFLAVTPWDTLLVSDDCLANTHVYELDAAGHTTSWLDGIASPNGLAFNAAGDMLFGASTFIEAPPVWKVSVNATHQPGTPVTVQSYESGFTPDGIAIDADGAVYVALNVKGEIHRIAPDGTDSLFAEGVMTTASLAFGNGPGFDPCTLYSTELFGDDLAAVYVGKPGLALRR